jgi:hypothetical protein
VTQRLSPQPTQQPPRQLRSRIGFEIELLAPVGSSRRALADELAARRGGRVRPVWHRDSEPSLVPGLGRFLHLTQGFEVVDAAGELVCTLVDDITLLRDLDPTIPPLPGWFRILTDDARLLDLIAVQTDPAVELSASLDAVAALWASSARRRGDVLLLEDGAGTTIALAAPQGGGRERACEIVTPPLTADHGSFLEHLLRAARDLGFTVPAEAAVHLHYDAAPFRDADTLANVVRLFGWWRAVLHRVLGTNPLCRRLAALPAPLLDAAAGHPSYDELRAAASAGGLSKFFDVNLTHLFAENPVLDTLEVRILPGSIEGDEIVRRASLVERLLRRCQRPTPIARPTADITEAAEQLRRGLPERDAVATR